MVVPSSPTAGFSVVIPSDRRRSIVFLWGDAVDSADKKTLITVATIVGIGLAAIGLLYLAAEQGWVTWFD